MKSPRLLLIIKLHIPAVVLDRAPYAFQPESVTGGVLPAGREPAMGIKGVFRAGILGGKYGVRRILLPRQIDLDEGTGNAGGGFHRIVQEVTKERSQVIGGHKIDAFISDIGSKRDSQFFTCFPVPAQNGIQGVIFTQLQRIGGLQAGGLDEVFDIIHDFRLLFLFGEGGDSIEVAPDIMN